MSQEKPTKEVKCESCGNTFMGEVTVAMLGIRPREWWPRESPACIVKDKLEAEIRAYAKDRIEPGMRAVSLAPMAGAQGEFAGVAMIRAYHEARGDSERREILVPDAAHGTNPATAVMCGYTVREIPTDKDGDVDLEALKAAVGAHTAGIMLTNPSTLGVFERRIMNIARIVHAAGGLLYYDGANLNAILARSSRATWAST